MKLPIISCYCLVLRECLWVRCKIELEAKLSVDVFFIVWCNSNTGEREKGSRECWKANRKFHELLVIEAVWFRVCNWKFSSSFSTTYHRIPLFLTSNLAPLHCLSGFALVDYGYCNCYWQLLLNMACKVMAPGIS